MANPSSPTNRAIPIKELKTAITSILDRLIDQGVQQLDIAASEDFYWEIQAPSLYEMANKNPELTVGSLSDDWQFLSGAVNDPQQAFSLMLIHAAPLLLYIGNKSPSV